MNGKRIEEGNEYTVIVGSIPTILVKIVLFDRRISPKSFEGQIWRF